VILRLKGSNRVKDQANAHLWALVGWHRLVSSFIRWRSWINPGFAVNDCAKVISLLCMHLLLLFLAYLQMKLLMLISVHAIRP